METEIERLLVRLDGDGAHYQQMLKEAEDATKKAAEAVKSIGEKLDEAKSKVEGFGSTLLKALSIVGISTSLGAALDKWNAMEDTLVGLQAALAGNGRDVETLTAQYRAFAREISMTTTTGGRATLEMLRRAEAFNITGVAAQHAVEDAINLAAAEGVSAEQAMNWAIALQTGNTHMLRGLTGMRGLRTEAERMELVNRRLVIGQRHVELTMQTNGAQIEKMKRAFGGLSTEVGRVIDQALGPIAKKMAAVADWFMTLDPAIKKVVVSTLLVITAMTSWNLITPWIMPIITALGSVFTMLGSIAAFLTGPFGLAIAAVSALVVIFVNHMGGWSAAWERLQAIAIRTWQVIRYYAAAFWDWIKPAVLQGIAILTAAWQMLSAAVIAAWDYISAKVIEFWEYIRPVVIAGIFFLQGVWDVVKEHAILYWNWLKDTALKVWEWIKEKWAPVQAWFGNLWRNVLGQTRPFWTWVRDTARDTFLRLEFGLRNVRSIFNLATTFIAYRMTRTWNEIHHFFTVVMPALYDWFANNWRDVFKTAFDYTTTLISNIGQNIFNVISNLPGLLAGTVAWNDVFVGLETGFESSIRNLPRIPARIEGGIEAELRREFERQARALGESWEAFRARRLRDVENFNFMPPEAAAREQREAARQGRNLGAGFNRGAKDELKKFDAVLFSSAEAIRRLAEYRDKIEEGRGTPGAAPERPGGGPQPAAPVAPAVNTDDLWHQGVTRLLTSSNAHLENVSNKMNRISDNLALLGVG